MALLRYFLGLLGSDAARQLVQKAVVKPISELLNIA
jgi:hypothetical protein